MSEIKKYSPEIQAIINSEEKFTGELSYKNEASFAKQQLRKSDFALQIARENPSSVFDAMSNLASIGLSLNPATKFAYLVPRDKAICLDISYIGLVKLATDTGVIEWVQADIVRESDEFILNGVGEKPTHKFKPFLEDEDRGAIVGVYCVAKTTNGDHLTCTMSLKEILEVKNASKGAQSTYSPWNTGFFTEMYKKTVIKRASKLWPKSKGLERLDGAINIINQHEGLNENDDLMTDDQHRKITNYLTDYGKEENEVAKLAGVNRYEDLTFGGGVKIIAYIDKVKRIESYVNGIKNCITADDALGAHELLEEMSEDEQKTLFVAPTKGGCLTVKERNYLSSEEFRKAVNQELDIIASQEADNEILASSPI